MLSLKRIIKRVLPCWLCVSLYNLNNILAKCNRTASVLGLIGCSLCHEAFSNAADLKFHFNRKHQDMEKLEKCKGTKLTCEICDRSFKLKHHLKRHLKKSHQCPDDSEIIAKVSAIKTPVFLYDAKHECKMCKRYFVRKEQLKTHLKCIHNDYTLERKPKICVFCGKKYVVKRKLYEHYARHSANFDCPVCDLNFEKEKYRTEHVKTFHKDWTMIPCKACPETFAVDEDLNYHKQVHEGFKCQCDKVLPTKKDYKKHRRSHEQLKLPCNFCEEKYLNRSSRKQHLKTDHKCPDVFFCNFCSQGSVLKDDLLFHIVTRHLVQNFKCRNCGVHFESHEKLMVHYEQHEKYVCELCGKQYNSNASLKIHRNTVHFRIDSVSPTKCSSCNKTFERRHHLWFHHCENRKNVKQLNTFKCSECGKFFQYRASLKAHFRIHSGERPFVCEICGKSYTVANGLKHHFNACHSDIWQFYCELCDRGFNHKFSFNRHQLAHQNIKQTFRCITCKKVFLSSYKLRKHKKLCVSFCRYCSENFEGSYEQHLLDVHGAKISSNMEL